MTSPPDLTPHLEDLWRYARVLTRDDSDADDLVQEAITRALTKADTYDGDRPLLPWLVSILRNTFLSGIRRSKAENIRDESFALEADFRIKPSQDIHVELDEVRRAFEGLSDEHSEVLHLVGVLGLSYKESAAVLHVAVGTVMSRLSRARVELKSRLEGPQRSHRLRVIGGRNVDP